MIDKHVLPGPVAVEPRNGRAAVLGEFGGIGCIVENHQWGLGKPWGYDDKVPLRDFFSTYVRRISGLAEAIDRGLSASVYVQLTDVENEASGLMTYDRKVVKLPPEVAAVHRSLIQGTAKVENIWLIPTSENTPHPWKFTTERPGSDWAEPGFDDEAWFVGMGGFGRPGTPGSRIGSKWVGKDIWLRKAFEGRGDYPGELFCRIHHDDDAEVYLNGVKILEVEGFTGRYEELALGPAARAALKSGTNVLAIHCRQKGQGQFIDVGLFEWRAQWGFKASPDPPLRPLPSKPQPEPIKVTLCEFSSF